MVEKPLKYPEMLSPRLKWEERNKVASWAGENGCAISERGKFIGKLINAVSNPMGRAIRRWNWGGSVPEGKGGKGMGDGGGRGDIFFRWCGSANRSKWISYSSGKGSIGNLPIVVAEELDLERKVPNDRAVRVKALSV